MHGSPQLAGERLEARVTGRDDDRIDQGQAPLVDAYEAALAAEERPFTIPGHKGRTDLVGPVVAGDVPLYPGLDTLRPEGGALGVAEGLAADLWGADWCRFSTGGSTHGNQTLALAVGVPGDVVVATRAVHRSSLLGFVLAGLDPVWVLPDVDPRSGLPTGIPPARLAASLAANPGARAAFVVEPGYVGTRSDVGALAGVAHAAGVPLVVDQAWGAHLGFHPGLPPHALAAGADALVTSVHKALPGYTQAAMVLARTSEGDGSLDPDRLDRAFDATHTTSPAGAIVASIDASRALLARDGHALLARTIALVAAARQRLRAVEGLLVLDGPPDRVDPTKLVLGVAGTGAYGMAVEDDLIEAGFPVEMADRDTVVAIVTVADTAETVEPFVDLLIRAIEKRRADPRPVADTPWLTGSLPEVALSPRAAFFAPHETVAAERAVGRVSTELLSPYPPGIPALVPGEVVTREIVDALRAAATAGVKIAYAADPSVRTLQVVARP
jgi:lysine decarboxylase